MKLNTSKLNLLMVRSGIGTRQELAQKSDITATTVTNLFRGATPKMKTLLKLARTLNVEPEDLLEE